MKKLASVLLALCLALTLVMPVFAASGSYAAASKQSIKLDGTAVSCPAYAIGGYNYFKLRDIAQLLKDSGSKFSVSAGSSHDIRVNARMAYTAVGGELTGAAAASVPCAESVWKLYVDDRPISCSIYVIGGNNYFKLRDLGLAIGFGVDYDKASNSVLITTAARDPSYTPDISFYTVDAAGTVWTDECFKAHKLTMINLWGYWCPYCCKEMPDLQKLQNNYASKGLQVIGISDYIDAENNAAELKELGVTYPNIYNTASFDPYLDTGYWPVTIFVDQNGKVQGKAYIGARDYSTWAGIVDGLLK